MHSSTLRMVVLLFLIAIGLLSVLEGNVTGRAMAAGDEIARGKAVFNDKCVECHGVRGNGKGPSAATMSPGPSDFTNPGFWKGDVNKKIRNAVQNGKGSMPPADLSKDDAGAVIAYMTDAFKPK